MKIFELGEPRKLPVACISTLELSDVRMENSPNAFGLRPLD